jgi:hypothetical protein
MVQQLGPVDCSTFGASALYSSQSYCTGTGLRASALTVCSCKSYLTDCRMLDGRVIMNNKMATSSVLRGPCVLLDELRKPEPCSVRTASQQNQNSSLSDKQIKR